MMSLVGNQQELVNLLNDFDDYRKWATDKGTSDKDFMANSRKRLDESAAKNKKKSAQLIAEAKIKNTQIKAGNAKKV